MIYVGPQEEKLRGSSGVCQSAGSTRLAHESTVPYS